MSADADTPTAPDDDGGPPDPSRAANLWWARIPGETAVVSVWPPQVMTDGSWAASVRPLATYGPPGAVLLGLLIGWVQPGYVTLPTESLVLLSAMIALGALSGALCFWLFLGFMIGDFLLANPFFLGEVTVHTRTEPAALDHLWRLRPGMLVSYVVLGMPLLFLPTFAKLTAAETVLRLRRHLSDLAATATMAALGALLLGVLVLAWSHAAALLLRSRFEWFGRSPSVQAIETLQETAWVLAVVAGVAFVGRYVLQQVLARRDDAVDHAGMLVWRFQQAYYPGVPLTERLPWSARVVLMIGFVLVVGGGIIESWPARAAVAAVLLLLSLLRSPLLPPGLVRAWAQVARVPMLLRLLVIGIAARVAAEVALEQVGRPTTWTPVLLTTLIVLLVAVVLLPPLHLLPEEEEPAEREEVDA